MYPTAFLAIFLCLLLAVSAVISAVARGNTELVQNRNKSMTELENEAADTIDVLVIGDSESYTTVSPMEIWDKEGIPSYVGGQTGQRIQESYYMLKKALCTQKPKVVMLETNVMFRKQGLVWGIKETLAQTMMYYFPVFRLHNSWKEWVMGKDKGSQTFYKGFVVRDVVEAYTGGSYMEKKKTEKTEQLSYSVKFMMNQIIRLCRKNNIQLVLYSAPSPKNYSLQKHNTLETYAKANGIEYLDLNMKTEELGIDWSEDSLDKGDHLNIVGAVKVSDYLGQYLKTEYHLKDKRKESIYQSWNESLKPYQTAAKKAEEHVREKLKKSASEQNKES